MARRKAAALDGGLLARKGEAVPAQELPAPPRGTKGTIALTLRLDPERYQRLVQLGARFAPRKTNQQILVEALDAYLANVEE
jgi:hypothetical protein